MVQLLSTIALDAGLAITALCSLYVAFAWGELCGIRSGASKSGLGGFAAVYVFFLLRWPVVGLLLVVSAPTDWGWGLLAAHGGFGALSVFAFELGTKRVQCDRVAPLWLGLAAGALLPTPAWTTAWVHGNRLWWEPTAWSWLTIAGLVFTLHAALLLQQWRGRGRSPAAADGGSVADDRFDPVGRQDAGWVGRGEQREALREEGLADDGR